MYIRNHFDVILGIYAVYEMSQHVLGIGDLSCGPRGSVARFATLILEVFLQESAVVRECKNTWRTTRLEIGCHYCATTSWNVIRIQVC